MQVNCHKSERRQTPKPDLFPYCWTMLPDVHGAIAVHVLHDGSIFKSMSWLPTAVCASGELLVSSSCRHKPAETWNLLFLPIRGGQGLFYLLPFKGKLWNIDISVFCKTKEQNEADVRGKLLLVDYIHAKVWEYMCFVWLKNARLFKMYDLTLAVPSQVLFTNAPLCRPCCTNLHGASPPQPGGHSSREILIG